MNCSVNQRRRQFFWVNFWKFRFKYKIQNLHLLVALEYCWNSFCSRIVFEPCVRNILFWSPKYLLSLLWSLMRANIEEISGVRRVTRFRTKATNWKQIFFIKETKVLVYWKLKNTKYLITVGLQARFWSQIRFVFRIENWRFKLNWRFRIENVKFKSTEKLARRIKF